MLDIKKNITFRMETNTEDWRMNIDAWIKQIRFEFSNITDTSNIVEENVNNIQHNYELIYDLKEQIDSFKGELKAVKLMQLLTIKNGKGY